MTSIKWLSESASLWSMENLTAHQLMENVHPVSKSSRLSLMNHQYLMKPLNITNKSTSLATSEINYLAITR